MSWWSKNKKPLAFLLFGFVSVGFFGILLLMFLGPIVGDVFCTLADCMGDGVHIDFIGQIPDSYSVEVVFPSGKRKITCDNTSLDNDFRFVGGDHCKQNGVFFEQIDSESDPSDTPPEELVVTVIYDGKQVTKTFHPEYEIDYPNGEDCPPMCYYATIEFDVS